MEASWEEVNAGDGREISNVCWEDLPGVCAVCLQTKKRQRKGREWEGRKWRDGGMEGGRRKEPKGSILV